MLLRLARMDLTASRRLVASIRNDERATVVLGLARRRCVTVDGNGGARSRERRARSVAVSLAPGDRRLVLRPC